MAQLTKTNIRIAGKSIGQFHSFSLSQGIYEHHYFRLSCPATAIDSSSGTIFNQSKSLLGQVLIAEINSEITSGSLKFKGIITTIEAEKFSGSNGDIVISGYSATKLLDSGPHCKTWEKKAVKNIIQDVLRHFPQNLLNPKITPIYPQTLSYYVQYKETAWDFICRVCSSFGEWIYFDGESLLVGPPPSSTAVPLIFGNNLSRFTLALHLRPPAMQVMGYDYTNHQVYTSNPDGIEEMAGLKGNSLVAYQSSLNTFTSEPKQWNNQFLTNKKQLDDVVNIQAAMRSAQQVKFNGSSGHPSVAVGGKINVQGQNIANESSETFGNYTVISVNHYTDGQGNYNNDFIAVPEAIKVPPIYTIPEQLCETQSAIVTDNYDPKGLGRVRVRFHWMKPSEKTPWIRMMMPHGGGGKGHFFIPEIEEEVVVAFENNSAVKPYVQGSIYNSSQSNSFSNAGNDVKMIQTRSGTKIRMNDAEGSVFVEDPSGNTWLMDGKGNIKVNAPNNMSFIVGKNFDINVGENMTTNIGTNETMTVGSNKTLRVAKDYMQFSDNKKVTIKTDSTENIGNSYKQMAGDSDIQTFKGDLKIRGTALTVIQGGKDVKVSKA